MNYAMHILKNSCHNLASRLLRFWSLRCTSTSFYPLFRFFLILRWAVTDPCFINSYKTAEEILWVTLEHVQIVFRNISASLTGMMMRQLLFNSNYLTDCKANLDLVFLRLTLHKNDKDFILMTPSGRQARDFSNDLVFLSGKISCNFLFQSTFHVFICSLL